MSSAKYKYLAHVTFMDGTQCEVKIEALSWVSAQEQVLKKFGLNDVRKLKALLLAEIMPDGRETVVFSYPRRDNVVPISVPVVRDEKFRVVIWKTVDSDSPYIMNVTVASGPEYAANYVCRQINLSRINDARHILVYKFDPATDTQVLVKEYGESKYPSIKAKVVVPSTTPVEPPDIETLVLEKSVKRCTYRVEKHNVQSN